MCRIDGFPKNHRLKKTPKCLVNKSLPLSLQTTVPSGMLPILDICRRDSLAGCGVEIVQPGQGRIGADTFASLTVCSHRRRGDRQRRICGQCAAVHSACCRYGRAAGLIGEAVGVIRRDLNIAFC